MSDAFATVDGHRVMRLSLHVPACGAWVVEATFEESFDLVGSVRVQIGSVALTGTVDPDATGSYLQRSGVRIVAGAGAWGTPVEARSYHDDLLGVSTSLVVADLARTVGETLGTVAPAVARLGRDWLVRASAASEALALAIGGATWYVDYAGVTHVADRVIADASAAYEVLDYDPVTRVATIASDDPLACVAIGSTLRGRFSDSPVVVRELRLDIDASGVRLFALCSDAFGAPRLVRDLRAVATSAFPHAAFWGVYRYRVVMQNPGDTRWILQAVSASAGLPDISPVSVSPGVAGALATLSPGTIVLVQFVEANPAMPVITHFAGPDGAGFIPVELALCAGATGVDPSEHATSAEAIVATLDAFCTAIGAANPGVLTGAALAGGKAILINAVLAGLPTTSIAAYAAALAASLAAKSPSSNPGIGWPNVRGA